MRLSLPTQTQVSCPQHPYFQHSGGLKLPFLASVSVPSNAKGMSVPMGQCPKWSPPNQGIKWSHSISQLLGCFSLLCFQMK